MDRAISVNRDLETQFPQVASACRFASSDSGLGVGADWSGGHFRTLSLQSLEGPKKPHIKKNIPNSDMRRKPRSHGTRCEGRTKERQDRWAHILSTLAPSPGEERGKNKQASTFSYEIRDPSLLTSPRTS